MILNNYGTCFAICVSESEGIHWENQYITGMKCLKYSKEEHITQVGCAEQNGSCDNVVFYIFFLFCLN